MTPRGTEYRHKQTGRRTIVCDEGEGFAAKNPLWELVGPVYASEGCAECGGKTSTDDSMWALYCLDCIQTKVGPALADVATSQPAVVAHAVWRCFHCGDVFTNEDQDAAAGDDS